MSVILYSYVGHLENNADIAAGGALVNNKWTFSPEVNPRARAGLYLLHSTNFCAELFLNLSIFFVYLQWGCWRRGKTSVTVNRVIKYGFGLIFSTYPEAMDATPVPNLWAILLFSMLTLISLESQVCLCHIRMWNKKVTVGSQFLILLPGLYYTKFHIVGGYSLNETKKAWKNQLQSYDIVNTVSR
jgi:hypothetical protein